MFLTEKKNHFYHQGGNMRSKWVTMLVVAVFAVLLVASAASAQFLALYIRAQAEG